MRRRTRSLCPGSASSPAARPRPDRQTAEAALPRSGFPGRCPWRRTYSPRSSHRAVLLPLHTRQSGQSSRQDASWPLPEGCQSRRRPPLPRRRAAQNIPAQRHPCRSGAGSSSRSEAESSHSGPGSVPTGRCPGRDPVCVPAPRPPAGIHAPDRPLTYPSAFAS